MAAASGRRGVVEALLRIGYDRVLAGNAIADDGESHAIYPGSETSLSLNVDMHLRIPGSQPKDCESVREHHKKLQRIYVQGNRSAFLAAVYSGNSTRVSTLLMDGIDGWD